MIRLLSHVSDEELGSRVVERDAERTLCVSDRDGKRRQTVHTGYSYSLNRHDGRPAVSARVRLATDWREI